MTDVIAIDPGPEKSAWVQLDEQGGIVGMDIEDNHQIVNDLEITGVDCPLAVEMIASYGMAVGADVFQTCVWVGRFIQAYRGRTHLVYRKDVKMALCGNTQAKDSNIRKALIDRYGPGKEKAVGLKNTPGPLYGVKSHLWAALAVGVTWQQEQQRRAA